MRAAIQRGKYIFELRPEGIFRRKGILGRRIFARRGKDLHAV